MIVRKDKGGNMMKKIIAKALVGSLVLSAVPQGIYAQNMNPSSVKTLAATSNTVSTGVTITSMAQVSTANQDSVTRIFMPYQNLTDEQVKELYKFTNVEYVDLSVNKIENLDTSCWPNLKTLYVSNNQLETLDVSGSTKLEVLDALGNYSWSKSVDLSNHAALKILNVSDTSITSLKLPITSALESVTVGHNVHLKSIQYPKTASGAALTINAEDLYSQDIGAEGKTVQWKLDDSTVLTTDSKDVSAYGRTATAEWKDNTYTIEYNLPKELSWNGDGATKAIKAGVYGQEVTLPSKEDFTITNKDYEWKGWSVSTGTVNGDTLTAKPKQNGMKITVTPEVTMTAEALKEATTYQVVYKKASDEASAKEVQGTMESRSGKVNTYITLPTCDFTREGYTFTGWKIGANVFQPGQIVRMKQNGQIDIVAQWKENTGTIKIGDKKVVTVENGSKGVYQLKTEDLPVQQKTGYQFAGWSYEGKTVRAGDTIKLTASGETKVIEPKWTPNQYFVQYVKGSGDTQTETYEYGEAYATPVLKDTADEVFVGWEKVSTSMRIASVRSADIYYSNSKVSNLTTVNGDTVVLKPVYEEKSKQMVIETGNTNQSYVYTGREITPSVTVSVNGKTLTQGTDYDVQYTNNINVGVATITVVPKGSNGYVGTSTTFEITKATMDNQIVKAENYGDATNPKKYDGQEHSITVTAPEGSTIRYRMKGSEQWSDILPKVKGGEYVVEYEVTNPNYETYFGEATIVIQEQAQENNNNGNTGSNSGNIGGGSGGATVPSVPSISVPVVPSAPSTPEKEEEKEQKTFTVSSIQDQVYTGKAMKPAVTVTGESGILKKGTDYIITYKNNKQIGQATVIVTGLGDYKETVVEQTFNIVPKAPTFTTKVGKSAIKVTVKGQKLSGYTIQYKKQNSKKWVTITSTSKAKTIKKLKKGSYSVRVRSYKTIKGVKYYSDYTVKHNIKIR